ncbi:MAG: UbiA-like polyprenyltransferase [Acidobacteriota bacterium]|nr:UbiA-like polyprenyltransferase [Acidobacteriota bacterium]
MARDIRETGEMIAFKHSIFALPFAVISLITATAPSWPTPAIWFWVTVAMVSARTAAMAFNRLADQAVDVKNPRTSGRALPSGRLDRRFAWFVTGLSAMVFLAAAAALNPLCLALAPLTLAVLLGYSFTKRFTSASHLWLGFALGLAPIGAWIAATGRIAWPPVVLAASVCLWVAGFDIIYSLQDEAFDREQGLHSLPEHVGGRAALVAARVTHVLAFAGFVVFAVAAGGGPWRLGAVCIAGALLAWQHRLISADDLTSVDAAFFSANGALAVLMGALFVIARIAGP